MAHKYYTQEKVQEIKKILGDMEKEKPHHINQKNLILSIRSEIEALLKKGWNITEISKRLSENKINVPLSALKSTLKKPKKQKS